MTKTHYLPALDLRWMAGFVLLFLLGTGIASRQPPFLMPDEGAHYLRAYEVSHQHLVNFRGAVGVDIPCNEYLVAAYQYNRIPIVQQKAIDDHADPLCSVRTVNPAGAYSFIPYIPAAAALFTTEKLRWKVEDRLVAARVANFAAWFSILAGGLLLINKGRVLIACFMLMPSFFWQLVALSADGATFAFCLLYVFLVVHIAQTGKNITPKLLLALASTAALIGSSKGVYAPITLLTFALWDRLPGKGLFYKLALLGTPALSALGTFACLTTISDPTLIHIGNGANPTLQATYIIGHPLLFIDTVYRTISNTDILRLISPTYAVPNAGRAFGIMLLTAIAGTILLISSDFGVDKKFRLLAGLLAIILFVTFCLPVYLTYTPVGAEDIMGVQGRYYLPILPLIFIAISFNISKLSQLKHLKQLEKKSNWFAALPLLSLIVAYVNIK